MVSEFYFQSVIKNVGEGRRGERKKERENKCKKNLRIAEGRFHVRCFQLFYGLELFQSWGKLLVNLKKEIRYSEECNSIRRDTKYMKEQVRDMEGKNFKSNIHLKGVPEGENKENVRKEIIEKITAKNPPDMNPQRNIISLKWYTWK